MQQQVKRPPFITPNYVSIGGLSYNIEQAVERFRMDTRMKHTVSFERTAIDYNMKRDMIDIKKLML
jgi:hypothetical protein